MLPPWSRTCRHRAGTGRIEAWLPRVQRPSSSPLAVRVGAALPGSAAGATASCHQTSRSFGEGRQERAEWPRGGTEKRGPRGPAFRASRSSHRFAARAAFSSPSSAMCSISARLWSRQKGSVTSREPGQWRSIQSASRAVAASVSWRARTSSAQEPGTSGADRAAGAPALDSSVERRSGPIDFTSMPSPYGGQRTAQLIADPSLVTPQLQDVGGTARPDEIDTEAALTRMGQSIGGAVQSSRAFSVPSIPHSTSPRTFANAPRPPHSLELRHRLLAVSRVASSSPAAGETAGRTSSPFDETRPWLRSRRFAPGSACAPAPPGAAGPDRNGASSSSAHTPGELPSRWRVSVH